MNNNELRKDLTYGDKDIAFVEEELEFDNKYSEDIFPTENFHTEFNLNTEEMRKTTPIRNNLNRKRDEERISSSNYYCFLIKKTF